jgi:hypothetical protein
MAVFFLLLFLKEMEADCILSAEPILKIHCVLVNEESLHLL